MTRRERGSRRRSRSTRRSATAGARHTASGGWARLLIGSQSTTRREGGSRRRCGSTRRLATWRACDGVSTFWTSLLVTSRYKALIRLHESKHRSEKESKHVVVQLVVVAVARSPMLWFARNGKHYNVRASLVMETTRVKVLTWRTDCKSNCSLIIGM